MSDIRTIPQFRAFLREKVKDAGGVRAFARVYGIAPSPVSAVLVSGKEPGPTILGIFRLKKTVQVKRTVTIERG